MKDQTARITKILGFRVSKHVLLVVTACSLTLAAAGGAQSKTGDFSKITHERTITFMTRAKNCFRGHLIGSTADSITIQIGQKQVTLQKSDLLFARESFQESDILFSGRSSWVDATHVWPEGHEYLSVLLKDGTEIREKVKSSGSDFIALNVKGHVRRIEKQQVATIDYVRFLPGTDRQADLAYDAEILNLLQPDFYRERFGHPPAIDVRLYDASLPEDNTRLRCK